MSLFVASYVVVALVSAAGLAVAVLLAGIPLPILSRAAVGGRYAGLGAGEPRSPAGPSSGRRVRYRGVLQGDAA